MNIEFSLYNALFGTAILNAEYKKFIDVTYHNFLKIASFFQKILHIFRLYLQSGQHKSILGAELHSEEL
jgi:hypothetical protein